MFTVLYTDDEPGLLELGKIFLESSGTFTVETALSARDALKRLEDGPVDCIVADYQMPEMNGIAFLKALRVKGNQVPFILFTGRGREEVVIEALNNGADFYLQKGGDPSAQFAELSHKIRLAVEHSRTMQALEESEAKYRSLADLVPDAVLVHREGTVVYVNPECVRLVGADSPEDLIGRNMMPFIHPDDRPMALGHLRLMKETGVTVPLVEERLLRLDGLPFTVEITARPVMYQGLPSVIVVFRDITERKKKEDELNAAYEQLTASEEELRQQYGELALAQKKLLENRSS